MQSAFWSELTIPHRRAVRIRLGPLVVTVARLDNEWRITREAVGGSDSEVSIQENVAIEEPTPNANVTRYATASKTERFRIVPVLPDRSVLTRPERPISILPRTEVRLYVGSPLWIRLLHGADDLLGDLPATPPKEAWVGSSTLNGELCYATRTYGRLHLEDVTLRPHRVMTSVTIHNGADHPFVCDHVSLPVRRLSVFASSEGRLWTEPISLERSANEEFAKLDVSSGPPEAARGATLLSGPRESGQRGGRFRAFGALFE
jgi:hypothetical protein